MRSFFKTLATIGALALGTAANAADFPPRQLPSLPPPPLIQSAPSLVDEFSSGWYLRGDVGYRRNSVDEITNASGVSVIDHDMDKSWVVGLGAGYKWQWFRADLTADYGSKAKFSGDTVDMADDFRAKIDSFTALVNVYGDLGTWFGLTPYVGVGAGVSHLQVSKFNQSFLAPVPDAEPGSEWNFAWAYMAGLSYKITGNYHVDLGYRHINLGDVTSGRNAYGDQLTFKKVSADEIRLGFRYVLD